MMADRRVAAIPGADCGELLVDVRGALPVDDRRADLASTFAHLRRCGGGIFVEQGLTAETVTSIGAPAR
jgi:D-alanyl-D-alanine dipeptidase